MNNKLCPLLTASVQQPCPCSTDNCAWWDDNAGDCSLTAIAGHLDRIAYAEEEGNGL